MYLEKIKTTDLDPNKKYTFVLPMGATEQHGPFLQLGTDSFLADKIIAEAEAEFPELVFLPTMRITCSEEHRGFMGSVWITEETMERVLSDICSSLKPHAKTIALTSFHGGNLEILDKFISKSKDAFDGMSVMHVPMGSEETEERMRKLIDGPTDEHAGNIETSMMLAYDESITSVPSVDYPKKVVDDPFSTSHLKEFSKDGIADSHPKWVISKEIGKKVTKWIVEDFKDELRKLI